MKRGEVWFADLDPVKGHEQAGKRPVLIISVDLFNAGSSKMVIVVPFTKKDRNQPLHVFVKASSAGLTVDSYIKTENIRGISKERLINKIGIVDIKTLQEVELRLSRLLGFQ